MDGYVELCSVANDIEADIVEGLLKPQGIMLIRRYEGAGHFLKVSMGISNIGIVFYVLKEQYEEAREIYLAYVDKSDEPIEEASYYSESIERNNIKKYMKYVIIIIFVVPIIAFVVNWIIN